MEFINIKFVKTHERAQKPRWIPGDLGFDFYVVSDDTFFKVTGHDIKRKYLQPNTRHLFSTGIRAQMPEGYGCILKDRSGNAAKKGLHVLAGVIDNTYTGEIKVCVVNLSDRPVEINEGDRIAQGVVIPEYDVEFTEIQESDLVDTIRGSSGFGSSGA
jgi:dUTP pyrophosphatase